MTNYPDKATHPLTGRRSVMTRNPYKIVQLKDGRYAVEYKDYPHVGIPDSWGTKAHATATWRRCWG